MLRQGGRWRAHTIALAALFMLLGEPQARAEESIETLGAQFAELIRQQKLTEAADVVRRMLSIAEKELGAENPDLAPTLESLASLYKMLQRPGDAEPHLLRALAIREKAAGADSAELAGVLSELVDVQQTLGRYAEAERNAKRLVGIEERAHGADRPELAAALQKHGNLALIQGRNAEAGEALRRALAIREKALGAENPLVAQTLTSLAYVHQNEGRYAEAEDASARALEIRRKALGEDHAEVGNSLNALAQTQLLLGRYDEAEINFKRALALMEKAHGSDSREVAVTLGNLAALYQTQRRIEEAALLFERAIVILDKALGPEHMDVATGINNLAFVYDSLRRYDEAAQRFQRALSILEKVLGPEHPNVAVALSNLGAVYIKSNRAGEAEPLLRRAVEVTEKALGSDHVNTAKAVTNLALAVEAQGKAVEARPLLERALAILLRALGPEHPDVGLAYDNLGSHFFAGDDPMNAAMYWRHSVAIFVQRARRGDDIAAQSHVLHGLIKALHQMPTDGATSGPAAETFEWAQWATGSKAAESLAQMAARGAKGNPELSRLARERQDLVGEWRLRDRALIEMVSLAPEKRQAEAETGLRNRLAAIDARIAEIDKRLSGEFPDFSSLASAAPSSLEDVQAHLRPDEALILFLDTYERFPAPEETFVWAVTKDAARWVRVGMGTLALAETVAALRCGLDAAAWSEPDCPKLTGVSAGAARRALPFDHGRAHRLYKALFSGIEDVVAGKQLLLVPSGPLTQLPFQVLVKSPSANGDHRKADWLIRHHALTVLPAVSSLKALRRTVRTVSAAKPMIGFGNPLLDGPDGRYASYAQLARELQSCAVPTPQQRQIADPVNRRGIPPIAMQRGLANPGNIRRQSPLPETAIELCAVAEDIKADTADIRLGATATESEVKALSESGALAQYRIVHFATHAAMAGELTGVSEPGLLLTPPFEASEIDDGYLSSAEVAALKLDADWVILSACNTAAGETRDADALSGLARAFIYAQARALLVSHWAVDSETTVKLITAAMRELSSAGGPGRAEGLRRSMLALIDRGRVAEAHPAMWAPFIVVGEGGR
jgi:CHAT domain-containing protein/tetratricopeptide (TPR) repeat protein